MNSTFRRLFTPQGFTLLEVLVAVAIFSIVLLAIHVVFYSAIRLRNTASAAFDEALPLEQAITILRADLANLVPPGGILSSQAQSSVQTDADAAAISPQFFTASAAIDMTSPFSEVQKVSYSLAEPTNFASGKDLVRTVTRNLLPSIQEEQSQQRLLAGVQNIVFAYYDGSQWLDYREQSTETVLPRAVKVQLELQATRSGFPARNRTVEIVVPIMSTARTNALASTGSSSP